MNFKSAGNKPHGSFSFSAVAGEVNLDKLRAKLDLVLISRNHRGELRYPEMKQIATNRMGFTCLDSPSDFDISEHVRMFEDSCENGRELPVASVDETKLAKIICNLRKTGFFDGDETKPSWEVLLINNFAPHPSTLPRNVKKCVERKYSVVLFRCGNVSIYGHHWENIFVDLCDDFNDNEKCEKSNLNSSVIDGIRLKTKVTHTLGKGSHHKSNLTTRRRPLRYLHSLFNASEDESSHEFLIVFGKRYESKFFNRIGESLQVNPRSVLLAAILGGLRRFIDFSYLHAHQDFHEYIKVRVPVTLGSGVRLLSPLDLPLAESDSLTRLLIIDRNVEDLSLQANKKLRNMFSDIKYKESQKGEKISAIISSSNASRVQLKLQGSVVIDRMTENFLDEDASIVFNITKYAESMRINLVVDKTLIPYEDDGKILFEYIEKECQVLNGLTEA